MRREVSILLLLLVTPVWGQEGERPPQRRPVTSGERAPDAAELPKAPALTAPTLSEADAPLFTSYRIGVEDLLSVTVLDAPEFSRLARVSAAGTIGLPLVKRAISVAGKTTGEVEAEVARALVEEGLLREPSVSVIVRDVQSKPVSVSGCVRSPIIFQAVRPVTLMEAITRAGGLADTASSEILVRIPARDGQPAQTVRATAKSLLETMDAKSNIVLQGGEDVRVPAAGKVYLLGGVSRPGSIPVNNDEPLTLLRALALSGGTTPNVGSRAFLLRSAGASGQKQEIALDLKKLMQRKAPDLPLQADDVIFIPDSKAKRVSQAGANAALSSVVYGVMGVLIWR